MFRITLCLTISWCHFVEVQKCSFCKITMSHSDPADGHNDFGSAVSLAESQCSTVIWQKLHFEASIK